MQENNNDEFMMVWVSLVHAGAYLPAALSDHLRAEAGISLAEQDLLKQLNSTGGKSRMVDLAKRIFLSKAGVTKMVDRLEKIALVNRQKSATDGRVVQVTLTASGKKTLERSRALLLPWVKSNLADHLSGEQLRDLGSALESLLKGHDRWHGQMEHLYGEESGQGETGG